MTKWAGKIFALATAAAIMAVPTAAHCQMLNLMGDKSQKRSESSQTTITSDSMNIDMAKNIAIFTGNVLVDDEQMNIKCQKMTIYLEEKGSDGKNASFSTGESNRDIKKIICETKVVIIRKIFDANEKKKGEQKAFAGRAEYNLKQGKIILSEDKPAVIRGKDMLIADKIILYRDSDKVETEGRSTIRMVPPEEKKGGGETKKEDGAGGKN